MQLLVTRQASKKIIESLLLHRLGFSVCLIAFFLLTIFSLFPPSQSSLSLSKTNQKILKNINQLANIYDDSLALKGFHYSNILDKNKVKKKSNEMLQSLLTKIYGQNKNILQVFNHSELIISNYQLSQLKKSFHYFQAKPVNKRFIDPRVKVRKINDFLIFYRIDDNFNFLIQLSLTLFIFSILSLVILRFTFYNFIRRNITGVIEHINQGMEFRDFNEPIELKAAMQGNEIQRLASNYNEMWLPIKLKEISKQNSKKIRDLKYKNFLN